MNVLCVWIYGLVFNLVNKIGLEKNTLQKKSFEKVV